MKKKLLIFDLDGTLADTIGSIGDAVNLTLDKYGMPRRSYEEVRRAIGNGARELMRRSVPEDFRSDEEFIDRVFKDYVSSYDVTYANIDGLYPNIKETVCTLKDRGYVIAVLSNKPDAYVLPITDMFFTDGEISFAAGQTELPRKPDPTAALLIAEKFSVSPAECAFIGDSGVDVQTAKNAGMTSVACSWGYCSKEALSEADFIIDGADELLSLFE